MRYLMIMLCVLMFTGCVIPDVPDVEPDQVVNPIECDGIYVVYFSDWGFCSCPTCNTYSRGTYWKNRNDGRMFLIGEAVAKPVLVYGNCPVSYIEEIFI